MKADGDRAALILQNKDGNLKRIGSKAITWSNGGKTGVTDFWVKAHASAMASPSTGPHGCIPEGPPAAAG